MSKEMAIALIRNPPRYFYVADKGCDYAIMKDLSSFGEYGAGADDDEIVDEYENYKVALDKCADMQAEALLNAILTVVLGITMGV
jgi:hypothetical protein